MRRGPAGRTTDVAGGGDQINSLALQPDANVLATGVSTIGGGQDFVVARHAPFVAAPMYNVATNVKSTSGNNSITATVGTTAVAADDTITVSVATVSRLGGCGVCCCAG
jgi:hypothetical protein